MKYFISIFKMGYSIIASIILIGCLGPKDQDSDQRSNENFIMITPFVNMSDMGSINEAFSVDSNCPWGFEHLGIDFFSIKELIPFQAVCPGEISEVRFWANNLSGNWQVNVTVEYNSTFSVIYGFEPMTNNPADGQTQMDNILVSEGQEVSQGDLIGYLYFGTNGTHVHFGLIQNDDDVCPEPYFTENARDSIMVLIHRQWPGANMCYE